MSSTPMDLWVLGFSYFRCFSWLEVLSYWVLHVAFLIVKVFLWNSYPCKMATGILAGSRQESRFLPGSCREMKNLAGKRNFPAGILTGSWQEKILAGILARIPARVSVPGVILPRHR